MQNSKRYFIISLSMCVLLFLLELWMGLTNPYSLMEFIHRSIGPFVWTGFCNPSPTPFMIHCHKSTLPLNRRKKKEVIGNKVKEERVAYVLNLSPKLFDKIISKQIHQKKKRPLRPSLRLKQRLVSGLGSPKSSPSPLWWSVFPSLFLRSASPWGPTL